MPRGRKPKFPREMTFLEFVGAARGDVTGDVGRAVSDVNEALNRPFEISPTWNHRLVRDVHLDELHLPSRAQTALAAMNITTVDQLMQVRRADLLVQRRIGQISLNALRHEIIDLLWPPLVGEAGLEEFRSLAELVQCFVERAIPQERKAELALGRLAPGRHRPQPLREFGQQHDLSRERIRQIVDEAFDRLGKPAKVALLQPLWRQTWPILQSWGRPIPIQRVGEGLRRRLGWIQSPPDGAMQRLFALQPELIVADGTVCLEPMDGSAAPAPASDVAVS